MYRNSEHYAAPTEGMAIAHVMAETRRQKQAERRKIENAARKKEQAEKKRAKEIEKERQRERLANCVYVHAWDATEQNSRWMRMEAKNRG